MKNILLYGCLPAIILALFSCKLQNAIVLEGEGKGHMALNLELPSYMLESMDIIAASIPRGDFLLRPENIAKSLRDSKNISEVDVISPEKGAYNIRFRFENFDKALRQAKDKGSQQNFLQWSREPNGATRLSIVINRQTYRALESRFPTMRDNTLLQLYGPATTQGMSRSDYLDMAEYSFGARARRDLPTAEAVISVQVPGKVLSQTGGALKNDNTVEFRLRLLDLALLARQQRYSVVYR